MHELMNKNGRTPAAYVKPNAVRVGAWVVWLRTPGGARAVAECTQVDDALDVAHALDVAPPRTEDATDWYDTRTRRARFLSLCLQTEKHNLSQHWLETIEAARDAAEYVGD